MKKQRLDKFISNQLIISRSIVRKGIFKGLAEVNGSVVRDISFSIDSENDIIVYDGQKIGYKEYVYILMNKPQGVLSAATDKSRETVVDLVPQHIKRQDLFPVGRLDKDTTGLLLITDDGVFAHNCISPKKAISKSYIATLDGDIDDQMIQSFKNGVILADGTKCKGAVLERIEENIARIIITEGKYHQIKRMFQAVCNKITYLERITFAEIPLDPSLARGEWRELTAQETAMIENH